MFCPRCGAQVAPDAKFCTSCGAALLQPPLKQPVQQPAFQSVPHIPTAPAQPSHTLSWKEFYNRCVSRKSKSNATSMAVICFLTAAVSLVLLALTENPLAIMDIAVYALLGVLLLCTKHWLFALLPTIYGGIFTVIGFATDSTPSGIVAIIVGIAATSTLLKANKAYSQYRKDGILPTEEI